ncbi:hypothetical protein F4777DRAFT_587758 [Nemania sp. FL0916]|nr:hypothetical protein F4777DRAFT_587758 [Nemania sp. FL0916]
MDPISLSGGSSRQRNCNGCVKRKRRCDRRKPACGRCVKQRYPCTYGGQGHAEMALEELDNTPFGLGYLADSCPGSNNFISALNTVPTGGADMSLPADLTFQLDNDFSGLLGAMPERSGPLASLWPTQFADIASAPADKTLVRRDYSKIMSPICEDYAPWQLADPSTKASVSLGMFKKFHVTFAQSNSTPYIHRYLYKDNMPCWMLQAFSMCLLYTNQTTANRAVVLRALHENVIELKETASQGALIPQEKLARVHALMFYQTIRMWDGDITLGQQADDDMALLESWTNDLCKVRDNLDDLSDERIVAREHPPESWERWIFAESLRRTCIMSLCVQKFWKLLKSRIKAASLLTYTSHLWDAQNSFDFLRAWKEKPFWVITMFEFKEFLRSGTGDDLDDFSYYFLALLVLLTPHRWLRLT